MNTSEGEHDVWDRAFSEQTRQQQLQEDSDAWRAVTGLLLTIISIGVCLAIFTVWICSS